MGFLTTKNVILWGIRWLSKNNYSRHNRISVDTAIQEKSWRRAEEEAVTSRWKQRLHEVGAV